MGRLTHLVSIALVVALVVITGTIAWVLITSVEQAAEIAEETEEAQVAQVLESQQPGAELPVEITEDVVRAHGDPLRVRQILRNLLSNAVRYGGDVIRIEVGANSPSSVYVSVKDNGAGVPAQSQAQMFQPFERVHNSSRALDSIGLGLAVSRQLAQLMEGDVTYRYHAGESIFTLSLPAAPSSSHLTPQIESRTIPA